MELKSERYEDMQSLISERNKIADFWRVKREKHATVRSFINGLAIASETGDEELTNYLTSYKAMSARVAALVDTYTSTRTFCEIEVRTNDVEGDAIASAILTNAFNKEIFYGQQTQRGFYNFISELAGELQVTGGIPMVYSDDHAWLPGIESVLLPPELDLDGAKFTHMFLPKMFSLQDLKNLKNSKSKKVNKEVLNYLIEEVEEAVENEGLATQPDQIHIREKSLDNDRPRYFDTNTDLPVWWYFEKDEDGTISGTLFTENLTHEHYPILAFIPKYSKDVNDLLLLFNVNTEIGGRQTVGTVRGMGELIYNSSTMMELVLNTMIEGDLDRSRPKYTTKDGVEGDVDEILKWAASRSSIVPRSLEAFREVNTTSQLAAPYSMLGNNMSGITSTESTGSGQNDLRVQALERQRQNKISITSMVSQWLLNIEQLCTIVLDRCLNGDVDKAIPGANAILCFRKKLKEAKIDASVIGKKEYGQFKYLRVNANHPTDDEQAVEWITTNLGSIPPQTRSIALSLVLSKVTGNPRLAETLIGKTVTISNSERALAQNESQTAMHRALSGEVLEVNAADVHEDHIPEHFKDLSALIMKNEVIPWTDIEIAQYSGVLLHVGKHIEVMKANPATQKLGNEFLKEMNVFSAAGEKIAALVAAERQNKQEQMTVEQQLKVQAQANKEELDKARIALDGMKYGLEVQKHNALVESRDRRGESIDAKAAVGTAVAVANTKMKAEKQAADLEAQRVAMVQELAVKQAPEASAPPAAPQTPITLNNL